MPTLRFYRFLAFTLLLALSVSCSTQPTPSLIPPIDATPPSNPTLPNSNPAPTLAPQASFALSDFNIILGMPTADSITANLYSKADRQVVIAYGTSSGSYTSQTNSVNLKAFEPTTIELSNLQPDTQYYYTVDGTEHTFHTQRPAGSTFTFTIDADPHNRDPRFNGELYTATLTNALADHPDFHINLGDTFMTEKLKPRTFEEAASTFTDMRPYFGILNADAPLFLVNGNHEGELGWLLTREKDKELPIWSTQLRQLYYPNPTPNSFYSGGSSTDSYLHSVRDGYYAWTWGDALFVVLDPFWYTTDKPKPDDSSTNWNWTLGKEQYDWFKRTLETSDSKYKFIFVHHLVGGAELEGSARGGVEVANLYEWGGNNADGSYGFDEQRPGWGIPIHQLLITNNVTAIFHGHDHVFVKQELDGIIYQECPQPSNDQPDNTGLAEDYGYVNGDVISGSGHLHVTVTPEQVSIEFIRAYLSAQQNGQAVYSYSIIP